MTKFRSQRGSVFLGGLMLVSVMTVLGLALFQLGQFENRLVIADTKDTRAFYMADAGLYAGYLELKNKDLCNDFPTVFAGGIAVTLFASTTPPCTSTPVPTLLNPSGLSTDGGYTVTATPLTPPTPNKIELSSTGCIPAANPCPADSAQSTVRATVQRVTSFYPILGLDGVNFHPGGADSYDSTQGCGSPPCPYIAGVGGNTGSKGDIFSNGTIALQATSPETFKGNILGTANTASNPDITIHSGTTVTGNVMSGGTVQNSGTVSGTITQSQLSPPIVLDPVPNCGAPFTTTVALNAALTPTAAYTYNQASGQLKINNTATIAAGSYCLGDVTIDGHLNVAAGSAAVTIKVDGQWKIQGSGEVNNLTLDASKLSLISSFGNDAGETQTGVSLQGGNTNAYLTVVAPYTEILVSGGGDFFGAVMGKSVNVQGDSKIHYDVNLENQASATGGIASYRFVAGSWRRCPNRAQSC